MSVHQINLIEDVILSSAFAFATHSRRSELGQIKRYVNAKEFRQVLLSENSFVFSNHGSIPTGKNQVAELPVFWFYNVDSHTDPLFVGGDETSLHRAFHLGDMAIVVESKHSQVKREDVFCGGQQVEVSYSSPLRAALIATAQLWWSANVHQLEEEDSIGKDWSWAIGVGDAHGHNVLESLFPNFSTVFTDAFHRSTVKEVLKKIKRIVFEVDIQIYASSKTRKREQHPAWWTTLKAKVVELRSSVVAATRKNDWSQAFELLSQCLKSAEELYQASSFFILENTCGQKNKQDRHHQQQQQQQQELSWWKEWKQK